METVSYIEAGRRAIAEAMDADQSVWCLGEDLGRGGVFGQYKGLAERFGPARISDAPISEAAIMGVAVGAAMSGSRPVVEMRFSDFALCAVDELVNQAAKARFMFGGQARVPITVREPIGMWRSSAAQHSQSLEAWYAHIPGLVVVCPATPADNFALLQAAIRCDDPVVYMEHKGLWPREGPLEGDDLPLGAARVVREGGDLTIVTWSATLYAAMDACDRLAADGIAATLIDLRTLWPWDRETVLEAAARTGRLLVVHEAVQVAGFGAEIVASVAEAVPGVVVGRLGAPRAPIAYAPTMEDALRVDAVRIAAAAERMVRR